MSIYRSFNGRRFGQLNKPWGIKSLPKGFSYSTRKVIGPKHCTHSGRCSLMLFICVLGPFELFIMPCISRWEPTGPWPHQHGIYCSGPRTHHLSLFLPGPQTYIYIYIYTYRHIHTYEDIYIYTYIHIDVLLGYVLWSWAKWYFTEAPNMRC